MSASVERAVVRVGRACFEAFSRRPELNALPTDESAEQRHRERIPPVPVLVEQPALTQNLVDGITQTKDLTGRPSQGAAALSGSGLAVRRAQLVRKREGGLESFAVRHRWCRRRSAFLVQASVVRIDEVAIAQRQRFTTLRTEDVARVDRQVAPAIRGVGRVSRTGRRFRGSAGSGVASLGLRRERIARRVAVGVRGFPFAALLLAALFLRGRCVGLLPGWSRLALRCRFTGSLERALV